ncbi:MAG: glycosyltransferase family 2 protein [Burkholderiales bacterium]
MTGPGSAGGRRTICIVCPVFNEELNIEHFYGEVTRVIAPLRERYDFTLLFSNNASSDRTLELIRGLAAKDSAVRYLTLSRNFGYQGSLLAALSHAEGDAFVIIDVDCEDPPRLIPQFIEQWEAGYDLVYGIRGARPEFIGLVWMRRLFYRVTRLIADADFIVDMAEFSLFSRRLRDAALANETTFPFIRAELAFVGFPRKGIPYDRERRAFGDTHYSFGRMAQFAIAGILSASTFPLRAIAYLGLPLAAVNLAASLAALVGYGVNLSALFALDWAFLIVAAAFIGLYAARIYKDGIRRARFIVDEAKSMLDGKRT